MRRHLPLALLLLVYTMNFLDRHLIYGLFPLIKKEFVFSDFQLALLGSTAFVLFYTLLGVPFGRLADRVRRTGLIAVGLFLWSLCSGFTGFMTGFAGLFVCRLLVGVGEATLGPAALSLLSDYYPPRLRATVGAIYSAGIPIGTGLSLGLGGFIGERLGWRWAFYLLGFPGILITTLVLLLPEPPRGHTERGAEEGGSADWRRLFTIPALRYHYAGYAMVSIAASALGMWMPAFIHRNFRLPVDRIGLYAGVATVCGGMIGVILGGYLADRWRALRRGGRMLFTCVVALSCAPLWLVMLHSASLPVLVVCYGLLAGLGLVWLGPAAADVQDIVGPRLRGLGVGVYFFLVNLANGGIAPPLIGRLNDALGTATDPSMMRRSLLLCPLAAVIGAGLLWMGARRLEEQAP